MGDTFAALETDTGQVAPMMKPQEVSNVTWALSKLERMPDDRKWTALETAAEQVAQEMKPQEV